MVRRKAVFCIVLVLVLCSVGCKTAKLDTHVLRPAEINLSGYERITVGQFTGDGGSEIRNRLVQALFDCGKYDVLDRETLRAGMTERELKMAGLAKEGLAEGEVITANALVVGDSKQRCNQHVESTVVEYYDLEGNKHTKTVRQRYATGTVEAAMKIVDLESTRIVANSLLNRKKNYNSGWQDSTPPSVDPRSLYEGIYPGIVTEFMHKIAPYTETVQAVLYKSKRMPQTAAGITLFKSGDTAAAADSFAEALETGKADPKTKPKELANATFNLAVARLYLNQFDEAVAGFQEAIRLDPTNKKFREWLERAIRRREEHRKLQEQGVAPPE